MKLPQISLRELFLLVALAAMGCGWWVERRGHSQLREKLDQSNRNLKYALDALKGDDWHWFGEHDDGLPEGDLILFTRRH